MRRMWSFFPRPKLAVVRGAGALLLCAASANADPIGFSSGGGMGYYYDAFLLSSEQASLEEDHQAVVRVVSNDGVISEGKWIVGCSKDLPRVVRPDGTDILVDLVEGASSATLIDHELWWTVCSGEARHWSSDHADPAAKARPGEKGSFRAMDLTFRFKVLPAGEAAVVPSLATVRLSGGAKFGFDGQEAVVSCSTEPTVYWKRSDAMVQFGWTELRDQHGREVGEVSAALYQAVCDTPREEQVPPNEVARLIGHSHVSFIAPR